METKQGVYALGVEARNFVLKARDVVDRFDAFELGLERPGAFRLDLTFIHTARVEVADLLFLAALGRMGACPDWIGASRRFQDSSQVLLVSVLKLVEGAPTRVRWRDRILGQPPSVGEMIEVHAGVRAAVQVGELQTGRRARPRFGRHRQGKATKQKPHENGFLESHLKFSLK